jgi:hypothetical protein
VVTRSVVDFNQKDVTMPVSVYYKVGKKIADNPEFDKGQAKKAINRFVTLNEV